MLCKHSHGAIAMFVLRAEVIIGQICFTECFNSYQTRHPWLGTRLKGRRHENELKEVSFADGVLYMCGYIR